MAIKAGGRKDELVDIEDLRKSERIAESMKLAGEANERAGLANERASANEKEAAQLRKLAEDERLARVKLEERQGGREIKAKQKALIISSLARFKGRRFVVFVGEPNDSEVGHFTAEFLDTLIRAGLSFAHSGVETTKSPTEVAPGITFGFGNGADDLAIALGEVMREADLSSLLILSRRSDEFPKGELVVWIGRKP